MRLLIHGIVAPGGVVDQVAAGARARAPAAQGLSEANVDRRDAERLGPGRVVAVATGAAGAPVIDAIAGVADAVADGTVLVRAGSRQTVSFTTTNEGRTTSILGGTYAGRATGSYLLGPKPIGAGVQPSSSATAEINAAGRIRGQVIDDALAISYRSIFDDLGPSALAVNVDAQVVGPQLEVNGVAAGTAGSPAASAPDAQPGEVKLFNIVLRNSDGTVVPYAELTRLTVLGATATDGSPLADFYVVGVGFDPTLDPGQQTSLLMGFSGIAPGTYDGLLTLRTDVDAALGAVGRSYSVQLVGTVVPEPAMLAIGVAGFAVLGRRRRRVTSSAAGTCPASSGPRSPAGSTR